MARCFLVSKFFVVFLVVPASAETLSGSQIKALFSGKSYEWQSVDGKLKGAGAWDATGAATITGNFPGFSKDVGKWRIKGDDYCAKWSKIRKGAEACGPIATLGHGKYQFGSSIITIK